MGATADGGGGGGALVKVKEAGQVQVGADDVRLDENGAAAGAGAVVDAKEEGQLQPAPHGLE